MRADAVAALCDHLAVARGSFRTLDGQAMDWQPISRELLDELIAKELAEATAEYRESASSIPRPNRPSQPTSGADTRANST